MDLESKHGVWSVESEHGVWSRAVHRIQRLVAAHHRVTWITFSTVACSGFPPCDIRPFFDKKKKVEVLYFLFVF